MFDPEPLLLSDWYLSGLSVLHEAISKYNAVFHGTGLKKHCVLKRLQQMEGPVREQLHRG